MNPRLLFVIATAFIVAQADSSASNPRHRRPASSHLSRTARQVQDSASTSVTASAATQPQSEPSSQSQPSAEPADATPTITIAGGNDPAEARYQQAKSQAKEDPEVKALKARADQAATEDEARRASVAYNKALFRKVREIDREAADRASAVEFAIIRKINQ
jgi:hypothetical protein